MKNTLSRDVYTDDNVIEKWVNSHTEFSRVLTLGKEEDEIGGFQGTANVLFPNL